MLAASGKSVLEYVNRAGKKVTNRKSRPVVSFRGTILLLVREHSFFLIMSSLTRLKKIWLKHVGLVQISERLRDFRIYNLNNALKGQASHLKERRMLAYQSEFH